MIKKTYLTPKTYEIVTDNFVEMAFYELKDHSLPPTFLFYEIEHNCVNFNSNKTCQRYQCNNYVLNIMKCDDINIYTNWRRIVVDEDKNAVVEVEYINENELFKYDLKTNFDILKEWAKKYYSLVNESINNKKFIPVITGGCDTRIMSVFWRDRIDELNCYLMRAKKAGGTTSDQNSYIDLMISQEVVKGMGGGHMERIEDLPTGFQTLDGSFTDKQDDRRQFLKTFVPMKTHNGKKPTLWNRNVNRKWFPFIDNLYLSIKETEHQPIFMRVMCATLFSEMYFTKYRVRSKGGAYWFFDMYRDTYQICKEYLKYWGSEVNDIFK